MGVESSIGDAADPELRDGEYYERLARLLAVQRRYAEAISMQRKAVVAESSNAHWHVRLGQLLMEVGDLSAAETEIRTAIALAPATWEFHLVLSNLLGRMGRADEALEAAQQCVREEPNNPRFYEHLAGLLLRSGDLVSAERAFREAGARDPRNAHIHGQLSRVLARLQRHEEAREAGEIAVQLDPANQSLRAHLQRLDTRSTTPGLDRSPKDSTVSPHTVSPGMPAPPLVAWTVERALNEADAAFSRGEADAALRIWEQIRVQQPTRPEAPLKAIKCLLSLKRQEDAERLIAEALQRFPEDLGFWVVSAEAADGRGDVDLAVQRWEEVRKRFPSRPIGYSVGGRCLRKAQRLDDAETILREAMQRFPDEPEPVFEYAWVACDRRDWTKMVTRWQAARSQFRDRPICYVGEAWGLRAQRCFDAAEVLLREAMERFPDEPDPIFDYARTAQERRDWSEAVLRWRAARSRFPDRWFCYTGEAWGLRELQRFDEAEALLREAIERFPAEPEPAFDYARVAQQRRDWNEMVARWGMARARFPDRSFCYIGEAWGLRELQRFDEAEALLREAIERFPDEPELPLDNARAAQQRRDWGEAAQRWGAARVRFPDRCSCYIGEAWALRELRRFDEADALLQEAMERFPEDADPVFDYARVAQQRRDWDDAVARWAKARELFPMQPTGYLEGAAALAEAHQIPEAEALANLAVELFPENVDAHAGHARVSLRREAWDEALDRHQAIQSRFPEAAAGYTGAALALRHLKRFEESELLLNEAQTRFPAHPIVAIERGWAALARQAWSEAIDRWAAVRAAFPWEVMGFVGGAMACREAGRLDDADELLRSAMHRFPPNPLIWSVHAQIAGDRQDWPEALRRWHEAQGLFPDERTIAARIFEVRMRLVETGSPMESAANVSREEGTGREGSSTADLASPTLGSGTVGGRLSASRSEVEPDQLMLSFESLGGMLHGCEFGTVQREFGAEPLGLLRWSDIGPEALVDALHRRFEGVGAPENTELFLADNAAKREYRTRDKRFHMVMHTFINENATEFDRMFAQVCRRLRFLKDKLIDDLESASKIFVYKVTVRTLDANELNILYRRIREYGPGTLLYVAKEDETNPNGTVRVLDDGLMVGYIDNFASTRPGGRITAVTGSWLAICQQAHRIWSERTPAR
jgi:tetratricopeptide (TPR) repeat protein